MFVCLWTYNPHYPFEAPEELIPKYKGQEGPGLKNPTYAAQIEATDRAVGTVLDELARLGIADDTLVIFTSDNGGWAGATDNRPLRAGKGDLYEGGLRVPLIVRWPAVVATGKPIVPGAVVETPVVSTDLTATVLDAAEDRTTPRQRGTRRHDTPPAVPHRAEPDALYFHYPHFAWHKIQPPQQGPFGQFDTS